MDQTGTGLIIIGWKLALALVAGSSTLTTVCIYLLARFTHVFDAYAGERARLLAQFHNLDKLLQQTERLTETTKLIEARVSYDLWDRQKRWEYKREVYTRVLEALSAMRTAHHAEWRCQQYRLACNMDDPKNKWIDTEIQRTFEDSREASRTFVREKDAASLVISEELYGSLTALLDVLTTVKQDTIHEDFQRNITMMEGTFKTTLEAARRDLGYSSAATSS